MATHHINKVVLDFSFPYKDKDTALQKAKELFYDDAMPQVNNLFDKTDKLIYIDKLEIDIGNITEAEFAEKFSAALSEALSKSSQITTQINNAMTPEPLHEVESLRLEDFMFFLTVGYWPWYIQRKSEEEIINLLEAFFENASLLTSLFSAIKKDTSVAVQRLTYVTSYSKPLQRLLLEALLEVHPYLKTIEVFFRKVYAKALIDAQGLSVSFINKLYRSDKLQTFDDFKHFILELLEEDIKSETQSPPQRQLLISNVNTFLLQQDITGEQLLPLLEKLFSSGNKFYSDTKPAAPTKPIPYLLNKNEDKISITNAGLILVHPYLQYVFRELNWIDDAKHFINGRVQQRAILFLQHILNGKSTQQEHLLVLNKIICGWPVELPLNIKKLSFSKTEKKAGEDMLDSLIEHWSVLRNTSRNGLIKSFIERKGLVQKTDKNFVVQVEKSSIDILLESLPFGILTIKLPWNEYFIYTEWTY